MMTTVLTELERYRMENYNLKMVLMQQQLQNIQLERANFMRLMEEAYPGYEWDDQRGFVLKEEARHLYPEYNET